MMRRRQRTLPLVTLCGFFFTLSGVSAAPIGEKPGTSQEPAPVETPAEEGQAQPELSPEMAALRDTLRRTRAQLANQPLNTRDNTPGQIIQACLAFGCSTNVAYGGRSGKKINAVGCLCWNYPCAGYRLLRAHGGRVMARIGYGLQRRPSQFLAVLAQSGVPAEYEVRVGESRGTVADLVEFEKLNCRSGTDLSFTLIGLTYYLDNESSWKNELGEEWSIQRLIREELSRSTPPSTSQVTDRLMGLSYAVDRRAKRGRPIDGQFAVAREHVAKFHDYALGLQNSDGSWHPSFFAHKGTSSDATGVLRSTGRILEWLVFSLPEDRLDDARVVRSVTYVTNLLGARRSRWDTASTSSRDLAALMHAAHALAIYDRRAFESTKLKQPAAAEEPLRYLNTPEYSFSRPLSVSSSRAPSLAIPAQRPQITSRPN